MAYAVCYVLVLPSGKEYSKADSRYPIRDVCIVSVEGITAVALGPLAFAIV